MSVERSAVIDRSQHSSASALFQLHGSGRPAVSASALITAWRLETSVIGAPNGLGLGTHQCLPCFDTRTT